jgi:hypothetical protein
MTRKTPAAVFEFSFARVQSEYDELTDSWRQVDAKAQAAATIAGIFMAASFAFVRNSALSLGAGEKFFLLALVLVLILSIAMSVRAMLMRVVPVPPTPESVAQMVSELLETAAEEHEERHAALVADTINAWIPVNRQLRADLVGKTCKLAMAQRCLLGAAILMALLTVAAVVLH